MKIFIPEIGTKIQLLKDWKFLLHHERRNEAFIKNDESLQDFVNTTSLNRKLGAEEGHKNDAKQREAYKNSVIEAGFIYGAWLDVKQRELVKQSPSYKVYLSLKEEYEHIYRGPNPMFPTYFKEKIDYVIKKGTILEIDRIYIRQGNKEYSSITFKIRGKKVLRFWAKLQDVNNIECKILEDQEDRKQFNSGGGANYFHG